MKKRFGLTIATLLVAASAPAFANPRPALSRPVVMELFTSQACSDGPPAEALLHRLQASHPGILTLALHVSYFNGPAWRDPFSSKTTTERQDWYASLRHTSEVFDRQVPRGIGQNIAVLVQQDNGTILGAASS